MATKYPNKPGLVQLTNKRTGDFFLTYTDDINLHCIKLTSSLRKGNFYYSHLKSKFTTLEELSISYTETPTPSIARNLKQARMKENYDNPRLLNKTDWPRTWGVYEFTHKPTGTKLIGYSNDVIARRNYLKHRLKCGLVDNATIQQLYNESKNFDDFEYKVIFTESLTEARLLSRKMVKEKAVTDQLANIRYLSRRRIRYYFYIVTENKTGHFVTGCCKDLTSRVNNIRWLLKTKQHRSTELQQLFDARYPNESFEEIFTVTSEAKGIRYDAEQLRKNYYNKHKDSPLCLDVR